MLAAMTEALRVAIGQIPNRVGDLAGNARRIADNMARAEEEGAAVLVLPELALTGYGLRDLVLHEDFVDEAAEALQELARRSGRTTTVVGTVDRVPPRRSWDTRDRDVAISAALICDGEVRGKYHKVLLPSYDLFDEARLFAPGDDPGRVWRIGDVVTGLAICEDLWSSDGPPEAQSVAGARILLAPNASPFHRGKADGRLANTRAVAIRNGFPVVYVNFVGGQDELAFDGGSIVVGPDGTLLARMAEFEEDFMCLDVPVAAPRPLTRRVASVHTRPVSIADPRPLDPPGRRLDDVASVWKAIVVALRDYVERNGYKGVALGLSGGTDSSLTAALAVDALGPERVKTVAMPSPETRPEETATAQKVAAALGIELEMVSVDSSEVVPNPETLAARQGAGADFRERAYARARAAVLGDLAEEHDYLVLATGNKSEISIGAASLYGDLAGGFAPLKDCPKTLVYDLAAYRNRCGEVFPPETTDRSTAGRRLLEMGVPSYRVLDDLVQRYVEYGGDLSDMVEAGHDPTLVELVLGLINDAELVRRYAPPGVKVTSRAFDQDRRMPISNAWRPHFRG